MVPKLTDIQYEVLIKILSNKVSYLTKITALLETAIKKCKKLWKIPKFSKKHKNFETHNSRKR